MKNIELGFKLFWLPVFIFWSGCLLFYPTTSDAATINTLDFEGRPAYVTEEVAKAPDQYHTIMLAHLRKGNINGAAEIARLLIKNKDDNADARAVLSIFYASINDPDTARIEYDKARSMKKDAVIAQYALAMIQKNQGRGDAAIKTCRQAIAKDPTHPFPHNIIGRILTAKGRHDQAVKAFSKAIKAYDQFLPAYLNLGVVHYLRKDYPRAEQFFRQALKLDANSFQANFGIAVLYQEIGRPDSALSHFEACYKINSNHPDTVAAMAQLQLQTGRYQKALAAGKKMAQLKLPGADLIMADAVLHLGKPDEALQHLKKIGRPTAESRYVEGFCHAAKADYAAALEAMNRVLEEQPEHGGALTARGVLQFYLNNPVDPPLAGIAGMKTGTGAAKLNYFLDAGISAAAGRWPEAHAGFDRSQGLISGLGMTGVDLKTLQQASMPSEYRFIDLGMLLYFRNLDRQALNQFNRALEIHPDSLWANYCAALVLLRQKKKAEARDAFIRATAKAPRFFAALYAAGELYATSGDFANAQVYYERALAVNRNTGILIKLGLIAQNSGREAMAEKYYAEVVEKHPNNYIGLNQLAWFYAERGTKLDMALQLARKADNLKPGNASIQDTIGWIFYHRKDYKKALEHLYLSLKANINNATVHYHIGKVYDAMGQKQNAQNAMKKALAVSKNFTHAAEARKYLE